MSRIRRVADKQQAAIHAILRADMPLIATGWRQRQGVVRADEIQPAGVRVELRLRRSPGRRRRAIQFESSRPKLVSCLC